MPQFPDELEGGQKGGALDRTVFEGIEIDNEVAVLRNIEDRHRSLEAPLKFAELERVKSADWHAFLRFPIFVQDGSLPPVAIESICISLEKLLRMPEPKQKHINLKIVPDHIAYGLDKMNRDFCDGNFDFRIDTYETTVHDPRNTVKSYFLIIDTTIPEKKEQTFPIELYFAAQMENGIYKVNKSYFEKIIDIFSENILIRSLSLISENTLLPIVKVLDELEDAGTRIKSNLTNLRKSTKDIYKGEIRSDEYLLKRFQNISQSYFPDDLVYLLTNELVEQNWRIVFPGFPHIIITSAGDKVKPLLKAHVAEMYKHYIVTRPSTLKPITKISDLTKSPENLLDQVRLYV